MTERLTAYRSKTGRFTKKPTKHTSKEIQWVRTPLGWVKRIIYRYRRQMCVVEFAAVENQGDFSPCVISKVWGPL